MTLPALPPGLGLPMVYLVDDEDVVRRASPGCCARADCCPKGFRVVKLLTPRWIRRWRQAREAIGRDHRHAWYSTCGWAE